MLGGSVGGWDLPPEGGVLPGGGPEGGVLPEGGEVVVADQAEDPASGALSGESTFQVAGWPLVPLQAQESEPVSILPPQPVGPKRGRPFGSGTGSHALRQYHKKVEQEERAAAQALALAAAPEPGQPGTMAYARQFRWHRDLKADNAAIIPQPVDKTLLEPLLADCPDNFLSTMAATLASEKPPRGAGAKSRATDALKKMSTAYLHPQNKRSLIGVVAESERFNMKDSSSTTKHLTRLGALTYFCQRLHVILGLLGLISAVMRGELVPFLLVIVLASDSTPLPVAQKRKPGSSHSSGTAPVDCTAIVVRPLLASNKDFRSTARKHAKILQSEASYVVTFRDPNCDTNDAFTTYEFSLFCNLQHLDRGTGENTANAWKHVLYVFCLRTLIDLFERTAKVVKVNQADRDGANGCADDAWAFETSAALHLRLPCVLHMVHTDGGAAIQMQNHLVSGVIANRLTLKNGTHNQQFFDLLVWVMVGAADLMLDTAPPPEDDALRVQQVAMIDILLGECEVDRRRAYVLKGNLRGNFAESRISVYASSADAGTTPDSHKEYLENWAYETASSLYVSLDPLQRGRWMLNAKHISEHALLEVVHQLGRRAFEAFDAKHRPEAKHSNPESSLEETANSIAGFVVPAPKSKASQKRGSTEDHAIGKAQTEDDIAAENRRLRGDALAFWRSNPGGMLIVLATCLLALSQLFRKLVAMSGEKWDREQQARETQGKRRSYRLFAAASGEWTTKFFEAVDRLMWVGEAWSHLPYAFRTEKYQTYAYTLLAKMIGGIRHHVGIFLLFPYAIFRLLCADDRERATIAEELLQTPECMRDRVFGSLFLAMFPTVLLLCGIEAMAILIIIAIVSRCDTGRVECRHASIRRLLLVKSGTWASHIAQLSANYMCHIGRTSQFSCASDNTESTAASNEDSLGYVPLQAYGGPARYFVRKWLIGAASTPEQRAHGAHDTESRSLSFAAMWEEYRRIKAAGGPEWQELVSQGKLGTEASRIGAASFGPKPCEVAKAAVFTAPRFSTPGSRRGNADALPMVLRESGASAVAIPGLEPRDHRFRVLSDMTAASRRAGVEKREQEAADDRAVSSWSRQKLQQLMSSAIGRVPGILHAGLEVLPVMPLPRLKWIRFRTPVLDMVDKVMEYDDGALLKMVDDAWLQMHQPFLHLSSPALDLSQRVPRPVCYYARVCVCRRPDLRLFVKKLVSHLRKLCHKDAPLRVYLDRCELIVRLAGTRNFDSLFLMQI